MGINISIDLIFDIMWNIFICAVSAPFLLSTQHNTPEVHSNHYNIKETESYFI
jgi:hypothetical protein